MSRPAAISVEAVGQHDQLRQVVGQPVERHEDVAGQARRDRRGDSSVSLASSNLLPEVVAAVERDDHLEIAQALLDLAAHAAERLQALDVRSLDPGDTIAGDDQDARGPAPAPPARAAD